MKHKVTSNVKSNIQKLLECFVTVPIYFRNGIVLLGGLHGGGGLS